MKGIVFFQHPNLVGWGGDFACFCAKHEHELDDERKADQRLAAWKRRTEGS